MSVHDWDKLFDEAFHDFHNSWIAQLRTRLNKGILPDGYYAAAEQVIGGPNADVVTLDAWQPDGESGSFPAELSGGVALADSPPSIAYRIESERAIYADKADRIAIRHLTNDRLVAVIEIISAGNKWTRPAIDQLEKKVQILLGEGVHVLLVDLIRSSKQAPWGLPKFFGFSDHKSDPETTDEQPFSLMSIRAAYCPEAFIELVSVGDDLKDMPLFLTETRYVLAPLEETYQAAWEGVPAPWKKKLEERES